MYTGKKPDTYNEVIKINVQNNEIFKIFILTLVLMLVF